MEEVFGLIDCNNFYVSCERLFRPDLEGKPIIVLSNNDGNAISRSNDYVESERCVKFGRLFKSEMLGETCRYIGRTILREGLGLKSSVEKKCSSMLTIFIEPH